MLALFRKANLTRSLQSSRGGHPCTHMAVTPRMRYRRSGQVLPCATRVQRSTYYFDAARHTTKTLQYLLGQIQESTQPGSGPAAALLAQAMDALLDSLCARLEDDKESVDYFHQLLNIHLSGLRASELEQLAHALKRMPYDCAVMETIAAPESLSQRQRSLMFTADLQASLASLSDAARLFESQHPESHRLTTSQAQQTRDYLAGHARCYARSGITLIELAGLSHMLAEAIGMSVRPSATLSASALATDSRVAGDEKNLLIDSATYTALTEKTQVQLFARVMRDVLELFLFKKLFPDVRSLRDLQPRQCTLLFGEIERVVALAPTIRDRQSILSAKALLAHSKDFGTIHIYPTVGTRLGHACIIPSLSLIPDMSQASKAIGTRYMRVGFRLAPSDCIISEWPMLWLNAAENEQRYPSALAWPVKVAAEAAALQAAARGLVQEWQEQGLPYRFASTEPRLSATGCRISVWQAVQRGMDDDARQLFQCFMAGLTEPDSPTEIALHMQHFMQWVQMLGAERTGSTGEDTHL